MSKRKSSNASDIAPITQAEADAFKELLQRIPAELKHVASPLLERLRSVYEAASLPHKRTIKTYAATEFRSVVQASKALDIDHNSFSPDYEFVLKEAASSVKDVKPLSPHFAAVIKELQQSRYVRDRCDEALSRTALDLILIDRLQHLQDEDAHYQLCLSAEVTITVKTQDFDGNSELIRGRADWALGYGRDKTETGSILIVVEANPVGEASTGLPQLMIYMAGVFESRRTRSNNTVFGMVSDGAIFWFAFLDHNKKFYVSSPYKWATNQPTILAYIDTILLDAIHSSPQTTPTKFHNTSLLNYPRYLKGQWRFGEGSKDGVEEQSDPDDFVDIVRDRQRIVLRTETKFPKDSR